MPDPPNLDDVIAASQERTADDKAFVERMILEERLRGEVRARLDAPAAPPKRGVWEALLDKDMLRLFVSAILVPLIIWTAGTAWQKITEARNAPALAKVDAEARQARAEAQEHADVAQMTVLLPWLGQGTAEGQISREVLRSLARSSPDDPFVQSVYDVAQQAATAQQNSPDPSVRKLGAIAKEGLLQPAPLPGDVAAPPPAGVAPTAAAAAAAANLGARPQSVYLQIYGEDQRPLALSVQNALRDQGIPVPGIENVMKTQGGTPAAVAAVRRYAQRGSIGVRYYAESDQAAATFTASVIGKVVPAGSRVVLQDLAARTRKASPGTLEIWFPCGGGAGC